MTAFEYGKNLTVQVFGQSHADAIGAVVDGMPAGIEVDTEALQAFLDRRAPGRSAFSTARREADQVSLGSLAEGEVLDETTLIVSAPNAAYTEGMAVMTAGGQ